MFLMLIYTNFVYKKLLDFPHWKFQDIYAVICLFSDTYTTEW